jgi:hypothetical protein
MLIMPHASGGRQSITIITGAGASISAGGPSTSELTEIVNRGELSAGIFEALRGSPRLTDIVNFEDVLHVLEELEAYLNPDEPSRAINDLKPFLALGLGAALSDDWRDYRKERLTALEAIQARLSAIDSSGTGTLYNWLRPLADSYDIRWFTLNYDMVADQTIIAISRSVDKKWYNGFYKETGRFRPDEYANAERRFGALHLWLAHLHGCARFGYSRRQAGLAHGPPLELLELATFEEAIENWQYFHRLFMRFDHADLANVVSPIISGLKKLERISSQPYSSYFHALTDSLAKSPNLLLIGYGGGDAHINHQLGPVNTRTAALRR